MVASGKADPAQLGQFQFFIGSLAYDAKDWARRAHRAAGGGRRRLHAKTIPRR